MELDFPSWDKLEIKPSVSIEREVNDDGAGCNEVDWSMTDDISTLEDDVVIEDPNGGLIRSESVANNEDDSVKLLPILVWRSEAVDDIIFEDTGVSIVGFDDFMSTVWKLEMTVLEDGVICDVTSDDHIDINPESDEYIALSIDEDFNSFEELDKRDISKLESSEYELITISEGISKLENSTPVVDSSVENEIVGNMPVLRAVVDGVTDIGFSIFDICDDVALTEAV